MTCHIHTVRKRENGDKLRPCDLLNLEEILPIISS